MVNRNQSIDAVAPAVGFRKNRRDGSFTRDFQAKPYTVTVLAPGSNKNVCNVDIRYPIGGGATLVSALHAWALLHQPEMAKQRDDVADAGGVKRRTVSWEHYTDKSSIGLVFVQLQKADGSPINRGVETATLLYSERGS
jgi:hypothetical protein